MQAHPYIEGDGHAHDYQGAKPQDDKPPRHSHDVLGYQIDFRTAVSKRLAAGTVKGVGLVVKTETDLQS